MYVECSYTYIELEIDCTELMEGMWFCNCGIEVVITITTLDI